MENFEFYIFFLLVFIHQKYLKNYASLEYLISKAPSSSMWKTICKYITIIILESQWKIKEEDI